MGSWSEWAKGKVDKRVESYMEQRLVPTIPEPVEVAIGHIVRVGIPTVEFYLATDAENETIN